MPARRPLEERFWEKVNKQGPDDCWNWTATKDGLGYGWIGDGDKHMTRAHRVSYILNVGPIPTTEPRTLVLHHCDNPSCVNPAHLWLGTDKDNCDDMIAKHRDAHCRGGDCHSATFTPELVKIIRLRIENGEVIRKLAQEYNVTPNAIQKIKKRSSWAWVD